MNDSIRKLRAAIQHQRGEPFQWGTLDCAIFAANIHKDLTGNDYAESVRGSYRTGWGALRLIVEHDGLAALVSHLTGRDPVHPNATQDGDFILLRHKGLDVVGIRVRDRVCFKTENDVRFEPITKEAIGWRL